MAASQLQLTQGAAPGSAAVGTNSLYVNATKQLCRKDDGGLELSDPVIRQNEIAAVRPQINGGTSAAPVGNVSTVAKMMGLGLVAGFTITPQVTGRVKVRITGIVLNSTAIGSGTNVTGKQGTGTAPANGAASAGTTFGLTQHYIAPTVLAQAGFTCEGLVTGLALNVAVWFDLELLAVTSGGATVKDVQIVVEEY